MLKISDMLRICVVAAMAMLVDPTCSSSDASSATVSQGSEAYELLVEAESFAEFGGWLLDPQFIDQMGSPYLLAHGLGKPVTPATTCVEFPAVGRYRVWVRAKDWVPSHHPGRFQLKIDDTTQATIFGANSADWSWQDGGLVEIGQTKVKLSLLDVTGFDGRCDAIFFTTDSTFVPPAQDQADARAWRKRQLDLPETPAPGGKYDVVVVGGGIPGCAATLTAARLGCRVALVQNRPVLGGNASAEVGLTPRDQRTPLVMELASPGPQGAILAERVLRAEENVTLLLNRHAFAATTQDNRIVSVDVRHTATNVEQRIDASVFIDCTGRASVGTWAGADYRFGREGAAEFGESLAPNEPDSMHHGNTIIFHTGVAPEPVPFPEVPWATQVAGDHANLGGQVLRPRQDNRAGPIATEPSTSTGVRRGWNQLTHFWEYGQWLDPYQQAEHIRDHLFCALYGTFANVKRVDPKAYGRLALTHVSHVLATGEYRRLMGDVILSENDIRKATVFPDAAAINGGHFCLHYPGDAFDFRLGDWKWVAVKPFSVPFRCLYSRNIDNLMMAGKHISVTHIAGSCTKTMLNGGQHGVAVGAAAYLCLKYDATPRDIYRSHITELQETIRDVSEGN